MPLLMRTNPNRPPFLIVEMPLDDAAAGAPPAEPRGGANRQIGVNPAQADAGDDHVIDTDVPLLTTPDTAQLYRDGLEMLNRSGVPYLVGGTYAFQYYAGICRTTKDFDIFVRPRDVQRVLDVLTRCGFKTEIAFHHWLAKAHHGEKFIDVIFSSGNGVAEVDDEWFAHAVDEKVLGAPVKLVPAEEMIWIEGDDHGARAL